MDTKPASPYPLPLTLFYPLTLLPLTPLPLTLYPLPLPFTLVRHLYPLPLPVTLTLTRYPYPLPLPLPSPLPLPYPCICCIYIYTSHFEEYGSFACSHWQVKEANAAKHAVVRAICGNSKPKQTGAIQGKNTSFVSLIELFSQATETYHLA